MRTHKRSRAEWDSIFREQQASGLSIAAFCREHSINYKTFAARKADWRNKWQSHKKQFVKVEPRVQEVVNSVSTCSQPLMITVGGATLHCHSRQQIQWAILFTQGLRQ